MSEQVNAFEAPRNPVGDKSNYSMKYTAAAKAAGYKWHGNWYTPHPNRKMRRMQKRLLSGCATRRLGFK